MKDHGQQGQGALIINGDIKFWVLQFASERVGKQLSRGGRHQLVNSVMTSISVHYMTCFRLPSWVISRLDKTRRDFLWWKMKNRQGGYICLIGKQCLPKEYGGLGVSNLQLQNISLLLHWWWKLYTEQSSMNIGDYQNLLEWGSYEGPKTWVRHGYFSRQLMHLKHFFNWSTEWSVANGASISFWFDSWAGLPLCGIFCKQYRQQSQRTSLLQASQTLHLLLPNLRRQEHQHVETTLRPCQFSDVRIPFFGVGSAQYVLH
jgi:hypothetical protein